MKVIKDFMYLIYPFQWADEGAFFDTRKITVEELPNGNYKFSLFSDGAGKYHLMTTIEIDPGRRFWVRVVEMVRAFTGATFSLPDEVVAGSAASLPGAILLTQEMAREEKRQLPVMPDYAAPVTSRGKTKTRREVYDERDILDNDDHQGDGQPGSSGGDRPGEGSA